MASALSLAVRTGTYAYDAYLLEGAIRQGTSLLTLDGRLKRAAVDLDIDVLEV